jgi:serine/threonine-protein kinase
MSLTTGSRLGSYEILGPLGAGGMGDVYRARDMRLQRDIALKVVSTAFTHDPGRAARFEREAQLLAALNHPHIATIYGLEQAAESQVLVMELVEGETLADRLAPGPMPVVEAIRVASQIADALQAAHERGIIHRDLKPANIALTTEGDVKVLDFGLAKALDDAPVVDASNSPTLTIAATQAGVILGTAAYMAPEQAKGKAADRRSDLWAFGCVLYEMLAGKRAFDGDDASETMAAVLRAEPDWRALPADVPPAVNVMLRRSLEKDRRARSVDAGAAAFVLREFSRDVPDATTGAPASSRSRGRLAAYAALTVTFIAAAVALTALALRPDPPRVARFLAGTPTALTPIITTQTNDLAISLDGTRLVYLIGNPPTLYMRELGRLEGTVFAGTDNAISPFFSPDGQWIGFWQSGFLRRAPVQGGPAINIAATTAIRGATWGRDDTIVFSNTAGALIRVPAAGGTAVQLPFNAAGRNLTFEARRWPHFLPDGRHLLTTRGIDNNEFAVTLLDLQTMQERDLFAGSSARFVPTGHIVYVTGGALRAIRFDTGRRETSGSPIPVVGQVLAKASGAANFDIAGDGSLVYVPGTGGTAGAPVIASFDRKGQVTPLPGIPPASYRDLRVSPDGQRVALATFDDVWIYDVERATMSRLTTNRAQDRSPVWTPDGKRILFTSLRGNFPEIYSISADGTGAEALLLARARDGVDLRPNGWSADGRRLLFTEVPPTIACAFGHVTIDQPSDATMLVQNEFCSDYPSVSPDGRWMAYDAAFSGRAEVYLERYPGLGERQQISTNGGRMPLWTADGRELYFSSIDGRQMFAVSIAPGVPPVISRPRVVFEGEFLAPQTGFHPYDLARDGRVVFIQTGTGRSDLAATASLVLVQNWFEELKRLAPAR